MVEVTPFFMLLPAAAAFFASNKQGDKKSADAKKDTKPRSESPIDKVFRPLFIIQEAACGKLDCASASTREDDERIKDELVSLGPSTTSEPQFDDTSAYQSFYG